MCYVLRINNKNHRLIIFCCSNTPFDKTLFDPAMFDELLSTSIQVSCIHLDAFCDDSGRIFHLVNAFLEFHFR
jgi:hypothetical protein